ncbi:MAG TPA: CRTAC1 family protein [Thermoanaerobaculia bacterium]|nr:CRTAC1 family protein [Thermoanaerobaculia bacterium]
MPRPLKLLAGLTLLVPLAVNAEGIRFREVSRAWGIDFRHHHGGSGQRYMVETMVGGVVMFDFDGDGDEDLFFVDGGKLPGYTGEEPRSRLFRNDAGRFTDWTERSGIRVATYGSGGTAGDVDGDGDLDLFVSGFGPDQLFRNNGDGTFTDVTARAGVSDPLWSTSSAFEDVDRDGDLDLYVANYVDFSTANHKFCGDSKRNLRGYCHPDVYTGQPHRLYKNRGDGTFEDGTRAAGLADVAVGPGLGVVWGDVDNDGWPDVYVANDLKPNFLFRNQGNGTFEDLSLLSGTSLGDTGRPEAGMGVDMDDYDGDGLADLVVTNFELETNGLYRNLGGGAFMDARSLARIAEPSLLRLAWGVDFADFDQDGDLDLAVANGHINDNAAQFLEGSRYEQRNQVFENLGNGRFREDTATGMDAVRSSRGLATGDLDGDGDLEVVIVDSNAAAEVYENASEGGRWLGVDLAVPTGNRFGIGARVEVEAGGKKQIRDVRTASSYLSQNALTAHFGLGKADPVDRLTVRRPGKVQVFLGLPANRRVILGF